MTNISQSDPRWANVKIGQTNLTIGTYGCSVVDLAMMTDFSPVKVNNILTNGGGLTTDGRIKWNMAANLLGLRYDPSTYTPVFTPCIACTDHYANKGFPTHFFIVLDEQTIIDPLDGKNKPISTYNIVSYRNISPQITQNERKTMYEKGCKIECVKETMLKETSSDVGVGVPTRGGKGNIFPVGWTAIIIEHSPDWNWYNLDLGGQSGWVKFDTIKAVPNDPTINSNVAQLQAKLDQIKAIIG